MVLLPLKLAIFWSNQNHSRPRDQDGFSIEESDWKNKCKRKQNVSRNFTERNVLEKHYVTGFKKSVPTRGGGGGTEKR
jgi:hypothetical protein